MNGIKGFEDIHSEKPYLTSWVEKDVAYIDILYVPPHMRSQGVGRKLVQDWIAGLDIKIKRVKLKAATLGGTDAVAFWERLGFVHAYEGVLYHEIENTMTIGVNGYSQPIKEIISADDDDRHWIESTEDVKHFLKNPQHKL